MGSIPGCGTRVRTIVDEKTLAMPSVRIAELSARFGKEKKSKNAAYCELYYFSKAVLVTDKRDVF